MVTRGYSRLNQIKEYKMKNANTNTSAKRNTLAATVVSMVANGDTITPVHRFHADEVAEQKSAARKRNTDLKTGQKNEQSNHGEKKTASTRTKLKDSVDTSAMLQLPVSRADDSMTGEQLCAVILETHQQLQAGQIDQLTGYAKQGRALVLIKRQLLTEKQLDESDKRKSIALLVKNWRIPVLVMMW